MAAKIMVHRENQIGGCITEISTASTRILIDFGEELPGSKNPERFEMDWGESAGEKRPAVSAVFFTHYHGDHIGRFMEVPKNVLLYMSPLAREILDNIHDALLDRARKLFRWKGLEKYKKEMEREEKILNILRDQERIRIFEPGDGRMMKRVEIGDIAVTPCRVDHSASEACMFLIETPDRRILHTGDFRGHGLQGQGGAAVLEDVRQFAQKKIDTLIIEGTMMSRQNEEPYSEADLRNAADLLFRNHRYVFLLVSSTNLDSIITFYQAARAKDIPMYCPSSYFAKQLKTLGRYAREYLEINGLEDMKLFSDASDEEKSHGFVTLINAYSYDLVERFKDCHPVVVYSMWEGYVIREPDRGRSDTYHKFVRDCQAVGITVIPPMDGSKSPYPPMHTSGHASPELITDVIKAANPGEVRPIHTEDIRAFLRLKILDNLKIQLNKQLEERKMVKREDAIARGYSEEEDHRYLSVEALEKFLPKGPDRRLEGSHHAFVKLVKKYPEELAFCFRGNSGDAATIYFQNHAVFNILSNGNVEFDFNHARYMKDWDKQRDLLKAAGFSPEKDYIPKPKVRRNKSGTESVSYSIGTVTMAAETAEELTLDQLKTLYTGSIRPMVANYFQEYKNPKAEDYFRKDGSKSTRDLIEKIVQQKLFLANKELKNGYYFYDLEFSQPSAEVLNCKNQPDMLAIRFDSTGKPKSLVFVEVKSKKQSLRGDSGVIPHVLGMERYPDWLLPIRGRDACKILNQYMEIGLLEERSKEFAEADFVRLSKEVLLVFTGQDTIDALSRGREPIAPFLLDMGYEPVGAEEFPQISLDGEHPEPMEVYRKDFGQ